jgi:hypothetical protein
MNDAAWVDAADAVVGGIRDKQTAVWTERKI